MFWKWGHDQVSSRKFLHILSVCFEILWSGVSTNSSLDTSPWNNVSWFVFRFSDKLEKLCRKNCVLTCDIMKGFNIVVPKVIGSGICYVFIDAIWSFRFVISLYVSFTKDLRLTNQYLEFGKVMRNFQEIVKSCHGSQVATRNKIKSWTFSLNDHLVHLVQPSGFVLNSTLAKSLF